MNRPGQAWLALAAALAAASVLAWWAPAWALDWQPALAAAEPWRAFSAAFVHWSPMHLGANLERRGRRGGLRLGGEAAAARGPGLGRGLAPHACGAVAAA